MNSIEKRLKRLEEARDTATAKEKARAEAKISKIQTRLVIRDLRTLARGFDKRGRFHIGDIARREIERHQAMLANR